MNSYWISSVKKWSKNVNKAVEKTLDFYQDAAGRCGFCKVCRDTVKGSCLACPLYKQYCQNICQISEIGTKIFWQIRYELEDYSPVDYERIEVLCRGMLNEILCNEF